MELTEEIEYYEDEYDITVLMVRDFGSTAWNLDSDSSDVDAIAVYTQDAEKYQLLGDESATEHFQRHDRDIDIQGWSLHKFATLLASSNPTVMEFLNSPITYYTHSTECVELFGEIRDYANENLNPIALYWHYRSLGKEQYKKYVEENVHNTSNETDERYPIIVERDDSWEVDTSNSSFIPEDRVTFFKQADNIEKGTIDQTVKRNIFAGRGIAYAKYVKATGEMPPMDFMTFIEYYSRKANLEADEQQTLKRLAGLKKADDNRTVGNEIKQLVERELSHEPDQTEFEHGEIERERVNEFVRECNRLAEESGVVFGEGL